MSKTKKINKIMNYNHKLIKKSLKNLNFVFKKIFKKSKNFPLINSKQQYDINFKLINQ